MTVPVALAGMWAAAGIIALVIAIDAVVRSVTDHPASNVDDYVDQIDADLPFLYTEATFTIDFGDTAWNTTSSALAADTHWEGLEQEWLDYVKRLPTTRETV